MMSSLVTSTPSLFELVSADLAASMTEALRSLTDVWRRFAYSSRLVLTEDDSLRLEGDSFALDFCCSNRACLDC